MAPSNGVIPAQQRRRQAKVIPVMPLSYFQKRKQQDEAAQQKKADEPDVVQILIVAASPTPPPAAEATLEKTMGPLVVSSSPPSVHPADAAELPESSMEPIIPEAEESKDEVHEITKEPEADASVQESIGKIHLGKYVSRCVRQFQDRNYSTLMHSTEDDRSETIASAISAPSAPPSSASHSTFHMPPPFVPANHDSASFMSSNMHNGRHVVNGMHHAHPSDGSVMFYAESNNSSPAPPPGSGNVPPYLHQQQQYVSGHGTHPSNGSHTQFPPNGYSPMGPPPVPYR